MRSCGVRIPDPVFSYTNKLYIHIYNEEVSSYMFSYDVGYTSTDAGRGCGGEIYNYGGWVSSPLYPNEFRNSTVCKWTIRVPVGLSTVLKINSKYILLSILLAKLNGKYRYSSTMHGNLVTGQLRYKLCKKMGTSMIIKCKDSHIQAERLNLYSTAYRSF